MDQMNDSDDELSSGSPNRQARSRLRMRDLSRSLPTSLLRTREAVMRQFRPVLRAVDLTEQQWRVVRALGSVPEIDATGLAMATFLLPPSLSRILRDLERRDLITRRPDPSDLRAWLISLTPEGQKTLEVAGVTVERIYGAITERVGIKRLETLMKLLRDIEQDLQAPFTDEIDDGPPGSED